MDLSSLPHNPGVYIFRDLEKRPLYVGKAINLSQRVSSYFKNKKNLTPKTQVMVAKIVKIEHIQVENELEALLLESDLIKRYKPQYNVNLKDDKHYKYIKIEKLRGESYKLTTSRKANDKNSKYFGPYPEAQSIYIICKLLRRVFPHRDCSVSKFSRYKASKKACLYEHIGICPAPCQSDARVQINNDNIRKIEKYLAGDRHKLFKGLNVEMKKSAKRYDFEKAAIIRDQIASYKYMTQKKTAINDYIQVPNLILDNGRDSVGKLVKTLHKHGCNVNAKNYSTFKIEIYDISNIQGKAATGSMVVLTGGMPDKTMYRRFKIKKKSTPDDFAMMQEILSRRFKRVNSQDVSFAKYPDLIVVDGGKGQLSIALAVLDKYELKIPVIGLAKRHEKVIILSHNSRKTLSLPIDSDEIKLLQRGRNEAHRFAIKYHKKLRSRQIYD